VLVLGYDPKGLRGPVCPSYLFYPNECGSCGNQGCNKMVFPATIREKSQRWVALSCDAHLMFAR